MLSAKARTCLMKGTWVWVWVHLFQAIQSIAKYHKDTSLVKSYNSLTWKIHKKWTKGVVWFWFSDAPPKQTTMLATTLRQKKMPFVSFQGAVAHSANHQARTASVVGKSWRMHGFLSKSPEKTLRKGLFGAICSVTPQMHLISRPSVKHPTATGFKANHSKTGSYVKSNRIWRNKLLKSLWVSDWAVALAARV